MITIKPIPGKIERLATYKGMSMSHLARLAEITAPGLYKVIGGTANTRASTAKAIAEALKVDMMELFTIEKG